MFDSNFLRENNAKFNWHPMAHAGESRDNPPPVFVGSSGNRIVDLDGNEVIDAVGGLWNVNLGYSCKPIKQAISSQLDRLPYYSTFRGSSNDQIIELAFQLKEFFAEEGMARAFFTSGGSDSVETCLRLARQYHRLRGEAARTKFISVRNGYHGTHFGGASVNGNSKFRQAYEPLLPGCFHIPAPHVYRNPFGVDCAERVAQLCIQALEEEISFQGPDSVAAFIMEPVLGAGGLIVPHESLYPAAAEVCRRHGVLFIADEVITGFGRTGAWSGSRLWGVQPDMMSIAKAITSGYFPFGAALVSEGVADVFENSGAREGFIGHGYTYSGHPVGAAAGIACLEETRRLNVVENAKARGQQMFSGLQRLKNMYEVIGDVRGGFGLMAGIELVSDRVSKTPLSAEVVDRMHSIIYRSGVMVRSSGHHIFLSPPLVIDEQEVNQILKAIETGLAACCS